jgi:hypothetical protein
MALISGVDFWRGSWDAGLTNGTGIQEMVDAGCRFMIAKAGQAYFLDSRWDEHKVRLEVQGGSFVKGAYWFLSRDHLHIDTANYFYPPFSAGLTYRSATYGGHSDYSVDFNRGAPGVDEGDDVRAAQAGTVSGVTVGDGLVYVNHGSPALWRTEYRHMKNITVSVSDVVTRGQKLGEISSVAGTGSSFGSHLHHVHWHRATTGHAWVRIKMRILGEPMDASVGDSDGRPSSYSKDGQNVTGVQLPSAFPEYTGASQARMFLDAISDTRDPTGWLCALDVEAPPTKEYGVTANWTTVKQFATEFWRHAPGYPLFIYARKSFWNASIKDGTSPANARSYGFAGLWTADWTQVGLVRQVTFDTDTADLSFQNTTATPYAGGYAGFQESTILQFGEPPNGLRVASRNLDGNAFDGTVRQLKALAYGTGDPDPGAGTVPNLYGMAEAAALTVLTAAGYVTGTEFTEYHLSVASGSVTRTDPPAGTAAAAGETVDYWTSLGPRLNTVVPDVVGELEAVALDEFTEVSLVAGVRTTANSATVPVDAVISTDPVAGTSVALASAVAYVVSLGPTAPGGSNDPTPAVPCDD